MSQTSSVALSSDDNGSPEIDQEIEELRRKWGLDDKSLLANIDRGRQGLNQGLSNGMKSINRYLAGTHKATYYLIGADSGVGKTTLADFMYIYSLYQDCKTKGIKLDVLYYSWEIGIEMKKAKWASLLYFVKYGVNLPPNYIIGRIPGLLLSEAEYRNLLPIVDEVEEMFQSIRFIEASQTPQLVWRDIVRRAGDYGEITRAEGEIRATEIVGYTDKSPNVFRLTVIDHIGLVSQGNGQSLKQAMDMLSIFLTRARNLFGDTCCVVQQFNADMQNAAREQKKLKGMKINALVYKPTRQDFADSKYTFRDADVVLGLMKPKQLELDEFGHFTNLEEWGDHLSIIFVMKNRYGVSDKPIGLFVNGIAGVPYELPADWNTVVQDSYIDKAKQLDKTNGYYTPKDESQS